MSTPCASWVHANPTWPEVVDSTTGRDGTRLDRAFFLSVQEYIDKLSGVYYGLPSPANIAEEVAVARGDLSCLDDRLSGVVDASGQIIIPPTVPSTTDIESLTGENYILNDLLEINPDGDAQLPGFWSCDESHSAAITYGDQFGICQVTAGGVEIQVYQEVCPDAAMNRLITLFGESPGFTFGALVRASATTVRPFVTDGLSTKYGPYHSGSDTYEWLSCAPLPITTSGLRLRVGLELVGGTGCFWTTPFTGVGPYAPSHWRPARVRQVIRSFTFAGTGDALNNYVGAQRFQFGGPCDGVLESMWAGASGAMPAGSDATITLHRWNSSAWETVSALTIPESGQYLYSDIIGIGHVLRTSRQPRGSLNTNPGELFALDAVVTGGPNWTPDTFVETRWRAYERPLLGILSYGS